MIMRISVGIGVLIRPDIENNLQTRLMPLFEHLNTKVYVILQIQKVSLEPENGTESVSLTKILYAFKCFKIKRNCF